MAVIGPKNSNFDVKKNKIKTASFLERQMTLELPTAVRMGETFFFCCTVLPIILFDYYQISSKLSKKHTTYTKLCARFLEFWSSVRHEKCFFKFQQVFFIHLYPSGVFWFCRCGLYFWPRPGCGYKNFLYLDIGFLTSFFYLCGMFSQNFLCKFNPY